MAHTITMPFDEGMLSHRGRVRTLNEDSVGSFRSVPGLLAASDNAEALRRKGYLYVVADGMGGHDCGDLASATAVQNICASYYADPDDNPVASLERAVAQANKAIYDTSKARRTGAGSPQGQTRPMGTTVTCAVILQDRLVLAHVGDSRAYRLRGNTLSCLTTDHDWISEQMRLHGISREEAERRATARGARGALLRALGVQAEVQPDILTFDWQANDVLLLCSDGLHGLVSDDIIRHILASYPAPLAARTLINAANSAGGHDNVTAVIVRGAPLPALLHQRRWQRLILASALAGACLFVALGLATRAANGQPLAVASHVLGLAGLPTLPPTVVLLPTSTSTATMPSSPTATATAAAIPTFTASPQAARPPIKPPPTRQPAQSFSGMPQPVQSPQVNIPEMPIVSPEPSPAISFPTSSVMPSVTSTPTEHPQPPQRPPLPEAPPPPDSGKPPAPPTEAPTAPPSVLPTEAPTAPPSVLPTEAPTAPPSVLPTVVPTEAPTVVPTEAPTVVPTEAPTVVPTEAPTVVPTEAPTAPPGSTPSP